MRFPIFIILSIISINLFSDIFINDLMVDEKGEVKKEVIESEIFRAQAEYYYNKGDIIEAIPYYEKAITVNSNNFHCLARLASIYFQNKVYGLALIYAQKAEEVFNRNILDLTKEKKPRYYWTDYFLVLLINSYVNYRQNKLDVAQQYITKLETFLQSSEVYKDEKIIKLYKTIKKIIIYGNKIEF